jgi:hypothetical protein
MWGAGEKQRKSKQLGLIIFELEILLLLNEAGLASYILKHEIFTAATPNENRPSLAYLTYSFVSTLATSPSESYTPPESRGKEYTVSPVRPISHLLYHSSEKN